MEGSGVGSAAWECSACQVNVHGEVMLWVTTDSAWQIWSVLYAEAVECTSSAEPVWHVGVSVML